MLLGSVAGLKNIPTRCTRIVATTATTLGPCCVGWGIEPVIAKRNTKHGSGLGKIRWVVERTISWVKGLRRMRVRYDRLKIIQDAWNTLAAAVICFRIACNDCIF